MDGNQNVQVVTESERQVCWGFTCGVSVGDQQTWGLTVMEVVYGKHFKFKSWTQFWFFDSNFKLCIFCKVSSPTAILISFFSWLSKPNLFICPARRCIISSEVLVDPVIQMMHFFLPLRVSSYKYTGKDSLMICHSDADHEVLQQSKAFCLLFKGYWKLSSTEFFHVDTDMSIKSSDVGCMCKWVEWREKCCGPGQSWLTSSQSFMKWL